MNSISRNSSGLYVTRDNRRGDKLHRNRDTLLTCALCVLLALPGMASAKKPSASTAATCAVLLPASIETGNSFSVKVVRVPSYPGSWHQPTIYTDVVYPMSPDSSNTDSNIQTINRFNVTYALANLHGSDNGNRHSDHVDFARQHSHSDCNGLDFRAAQERQDETDQMLLDHTRRAG